MATLTPHTSMTTSFEIGNITHQHQASANTTATQATSAMHTEQERVYLLGLDVGSTTSSALIASASLSQSSVGRMQFSDIRLESRCEPVFTPWVDQDTPSRTLDLEKIAQLISSWLAQSQIPAEHLFSGGSIITGLAAQAPNTSGLQSLIKQLMGNSVIATADDPSLESWLAFMGSCAALSRHHAETPILNLDIGGGTTNAALGLTGDVLATGCYFIGARHFQFVPGSYQLAGLSRYGQALLEAFQIDKTVGDTLTLEERTQIIDYYIQALEAIVKQQTEFFDSALGALHQQVCLYYPMAPRYAHITRPQVTFSGGVGELVYQALSGKSLPSTTYFGDFGIDLANAIIASPCLNQTLHAYVPENQGRATVYGLTLHNTEISGRTLHLPNPDMLPLSDLAIVAKLSLDMPAAQWTSAFQLAAKQQRGACIQIKALDAQHAMSPLDYIRKLAQTIQRHYMATDYPKHQPLVILLESNTGKVLGQYCSDWGTRMSNLIVLDEVPMRHAQFVHIGRLHQQLLAVSFFGMHS